MLAVMCAEGHVDLQGGVGEETVVFKVLATTLFHPVTTYSLKRLPYGAVPSMEEKARGKNQGNTERG